MKLEKKACLKSGKILGINDFEFFEFPDMKLDSIPQIDINIKLEKLIRKFKPQIVYTTPYNDLNKDHQKVYESTLVSTRPLKNIVNQVLSYEIPGFTKNPFQASVYENITKEFSTKIKAFECYKSEIENFPHPRSIKSLESVSMYRGVEGRLSKSRGI